uniref:uncharacterized protein C6orf47 homolog n=1 Tax=Pristiophorus japonicus TaxID=55135 RepID=UPI00398E422E
MSLAAFLLVTFMGNTAVRAAAERGSPAETVAQGGAVASTSPRMKRARWLLRLVPNLAALLARALGWLKPSLRWLRRRIKADRSQLEQEVKLDEVDLQHLGRKDEEEEAKQEEKEAEEEVAVGPQGAPGGEAPTRRCEAPEHFEISFNFIRHLFDMFVVGFLCLASPVFRMALDVLGLRGLAKLWLHGMALFLVVCYGMALVLWLVQTYMVQLALLFGGVQLMVLGVSIQHQEKVDLEVETKDLEDSIAPSGP